jgi:hypothetical protein
VEPRLGREAAHPPARHRRCCHEPLADLGEPLGWRDRRAGGDPRTTGVDIADAGVVAVEPVAEPGLEDLERRRVPAVALEQGEHALPFAAVG